VNTRLTLFSKALILLSLAAIVFALIGEVSLAGTLLCIVVRVMLSIFIAGIIYGFVTATIKHL